MAVAPWIAEKSLWCHIGRTYWKPTFWNSPEIHPFGSQGKLVYEEVSAGSTLLLNYPEGVSVGCSCWLLLTGRRCEGQVLEKLSARQEPGPGEAPSRREPGAGEAATGEGWALGEPQGLQDLAAGQVVISGGPLRGNTWGSGKETSSFDVSPVPSTDSRMCQPAKVKYVKGLAPFSQGRQ